MRMWGCPCGALPHRFFDCRYHYAACGSTAKRFECDDYPDDDSKATTHNIYVTFTDPTKISAVRLQ